MKVLLFSITLLTSFASFSIGGEWLLQVSFYYEGDYREAYIVMNDPPGEIDSLVGSEGEFQIWFEEKFKDHNKINFYRNIIQQDNISNSAAFPMHSFQLPQNGQFQLNTAGITDMKLIKVWDRIAYGIEILTHLEEKDTTWISGTFEHIEKDPVVGCRLELYSFENVTKDDPMVIALYQLYNQCEERNRKQQSELKSIIMKLKAKKVVVSELCGC